jgi:hypothetical protein
MHSFVVFSVANSWLVVAYIEGWLAYYGGEESCINCNFLAIATF